MRGTRWLLLLAIVVVLGAVGATYHLKRQAQERDAPAPRKALPENVKAEGDRWVYTHTDGERLTVEVRASRMRQVDAPSSKVELDDVELHMYDPDGKAYDRITSASASFDTVTGDLYSDGDVEIVLGVPADGSPPEQPVIIRSSGVRFDVKSGKASTGRAASFVFGAGEGRSTGATYEPDWGDLRMHRDAVLHWKGSGEPMLVEAGELVYKEDHSIVYLSPWSRLRRGTLTLDAANSAVTIEEGAIRVVDAHEARGRSQHNSRELDYSADFLSMRFTADGAMEQIHGRGNARLTSASESARTTVTANEILLEFAPRDGDSILTTALARGGAVLESKPLKQPGRPLPETRVMRSEAIKTVMRADGQAIHVLETGEPGTVEFLPNLPGQRRRRLDGERLSIQFGDNNQIQSFRGIQVATKTEPLAGADLPPALTWSTDLLASFDPKTGEMSELQQWGKFRYQEGERQAKADKAVLDSPRNVINLAGKARVWDKQGSVSADVIELDQENNNFVATGSVSSTRLPESGPASSGALLASNKPIHATAHRMVSTDSNRKIVYEGNSVLWQGANRLEAHQVEIERSQGTLTAKGRVLSRSTEQSEKNPRSRFTVVRANQLVYTEEERLAHYRGEVHLQRPGMDIDAEQLRAFFRKDDQSGLEQALADGQVRIVQKTEERTRTGTGESAEYYIDLEKVILSGGTAKMVDSVKGTTEGRKLTYFARDDRLLVDGAESKPAESRLRRR